MPMSTNPATATGQPQRSCPVHATAINRLTPTTTARLDPIAMVRRSAWSEYEAANAGVGGRTQSAVVAGTSCPASNNKEEHRRPAAQEPRPTRVSTRETGAVPGPRGPFDTNNHRDSRAASATCRKSVDLVRYARPTRIPPDRDTSRAPRPARPRRPRDRDARATRTAVVDFGDDRRGDPDHRVRGPTSAHPPAARPRSRRTPAGASSG